MKILFACEESGVGREAFRKKGHNAWSCDLKPSRIPGQHYQCDVREVIGQQWDMMIAHPVCTRLSNSGVRWLYNNGRGADGVNIEKVIELGEGINFFNLFLKQDHIPKVMVENPVQHEHALKRIIQPYSQIIQPWQFGHKEMKATCLWLKGLPPLVPTDIVGPPPKDKEERKKWAVVHRMAPGPERTAERSKTYPGIADAFAEQWG